MGKETALQFEGDGAFAGVAAGVVDADRGAGGELLGQQQIVLAEGLGRAVAGENRQAESHASGAQGHGHHRVDTVDLDTAGTLR